MADDSGIDPRYAAQFQRGFDPATHTAEEARAPAPRPDAPVRLPGGPVPTAERVAPGPRIPAPPIVEQPPAAPTATSAVADPDEGDKDPVTRPRLEWALLGVSLGLILVGVGLLFASAELYGTGYSGPIDHARYLRDLALQQLPGPFVLAGAVAFSLWVALRSVHPARRSS